MRNWLKRLPKKERTITLATKITIVRGLLIPFILGAMIVQDWSAAFWLFVIASATDVLDGGLARFRNEQTVLGAALDPMVDKLLVLAVYCTLAFIQTPLFIIPKWFFIVVLTKELLLVLGVIYFFNKHGFFRVQPSQLGKLAMTVQIGFISWLFSCYFFHWMPYKTYYLMLGLVLVFVTLSFVQYACRGLAQVFYGALYEK